MYNYSEENSAILNLLTIETELEWIDRHRKTEIGLIMHFIPRVSRKV